MNETLILLEFDGDVCSGSRHAPAKTRRSNSRLESLEGRMNQAHGVPPLMWVAECGARGMLFADAPILAARPECFGCRVKLARRPPAPYGRYETDEERIEARRRAWRESKRRGRCAA